MRILECSTKGVPLGLAHGPGILEFINSKPGLIDYVEIPFEQLRHSSELSSIQESVPVILHCASLSVAGFVLPSKATIDAITNQVDRTQTPWIGEHLAFVSADGINEEADRDSNPTNLTFTLCPQMSEETVDRVVSNLDVFRPLFPVPLILENSPQYYDIPGSTMNLVDFVGRVVERCNVGLLLDLSHHMITCMNTGVDAFLEIQRLPLESVVEIHVSGMSRQSGTVWDDHASPMPEEMFELLELVLMRARPRALTIEYNWSELPQPVLLSHVSKLRNMLDRL
jgi:uncharacterized protein (UPF0276 family)